MTRGDAYFLLFIVVLGIAYILLKLPNIRTPHNLSKRLERQKKERKTYVKYLKLLNLKIEPKYYRSAQYLISLVLTLYIVLIYFSSNYIPYIETVVVLVILLLIVPETGIIILTWIKSKLAFNKVKTQTEIYQAMLEIRMFAKLGYQGNASNVIKRIIEGTTYINKELTELRQGWNNSNKEKIVDDFVQSLGTEEAKELGAILQKLDEVDTQEFEQQIEVYLDKIFARRQTQKENSDKQKSDILFTLVIIVCVLILLNFTNIIMGEGIMKLYDTF